MSNATTGNAGMTNVDQVKAVLRKMNSQFTISDIIQHIPEMSRDQASKALRSIKYVKSSGRGSYTVKGRKTW